MAGRGATPALDGAHVEKVPIESSQRPVYGGRYEVDGELGRGGMGRVLRARDVKLGRAVAVKVLAPGPHSNEQLMRFEQEARAAGALNHPNIVDVHDVGEQAGEPYLVTELLEGETLQEVLSRGALPANQVLGLATQLAEGLAAAHARGIVHRDLKPENLFLTTAGRLKILDFGIAKLLHEPARLRTDTGAVVGTPQYMSPEQVRGERADARSDVFAFGCLLHEMLTGESPFKRERDVEAAYAILHDPPARLPPTAPPRLARIAARCLEKDPSQRPPDARAILQELGGPGRRFGVPSRLPRRFGIPVAGALLLIASVMSGNARKMVAGGIEWWRRAGTPTSSGPVTMAVLPLANLSGDPSQDYFSDGMTEEIIGKLSRLGPLAVTARSSVARYKGSVKGAQEIGRELGVAYLLEGSVRRAGDRFRVSATLVKAADAFQVWHETIDGKLDDVFEVQERVATRIVEALQVRLSPDETDSLHRWGTRNATAYDEYLRGQALVERHNRRENIEAARGYYQRALQFDPDFAPAMVGLAIAEGEMYRNFDATPEHLAKARVLLDRALAVDPKVPQANAASGLLRAVAWDYRGAAEDFRRATAAEPRNHFLWDGLCFALGYVVPAEAPALAEAERACRRALELNPSSVEAYYHLTRVLALSGRLAEAEQAVNRIAELSPRSNYVFSGRYWIYLYSNRPRQALDALAQGDVVNTGLGMAWKTTALAQAGDLDGALAALEGALAKGYRDVAQLYGDPYLEPLRRDPRFARLLARHGIDPGAPPEGHSPARPR